MISSKYIYFYTLNICEFNSLFIDPLKINSCITDADATTSTTTNTTTSTTITTSKKKQKYLWLLI